MVTAIKSNYRSAPISEKQMAMLVYAEKLTTHPTEMKRADVDALRDTGFVDHEVLDIAHVVAYYNYVNRMANGLGVELEPYWGED